MSTRTLEERLDTERERIFQATSIVSLVGQRLARVTGDEEAMEIAAITSEVSFALDSVMELLGTTAERLEMIPQEERSLSA